MRTKKRKTKKIFCFLCVSVCLASKFRYCNGVRNGPNRAPKVLRKLIAKISTAFYALLREPIACARNPLCVRVFGAFAWP